MTPAFPQWNSPLVDPASGQMSAQWLTFFQWVWSLRTVVSKGISAAGSSISDATPLQGDWNEITVCGVGQGVSIGPGVGAGEEIVVKNATLTDLLVYPLQNAKIDGHAVNAAYTLPAGKLQVFRQFSDTQMYSEQLG